MKDRLVIVCGPALGDVLSIIDFCNAHNEFQYTIVVPEEFSLLSFLCETSVQLQPYYGNFYKGLWSALRISKGRKVYCFAGGRIFAGVGRRLGPVIVPGNPNLFPNKFEHFADWLSIVQKPPLEPELLTRTLFKKFNSLGSSRVVFFPSGGNPSSPKGFKNLIDPRKLPPELIVNGVEAVFGRESHEKLVFGRQFPHVSYSSLGELIDVIENVDIVIGIDSGPLYLALALGKTVVGLFGPTDSSYFGVSYFGKLYLLGNRFSCQGCYSAWEIGKREGCVLRPCMRGQSFELN